MLEFFFKPFCIAFAVTTTVLLVFLSVTRASSYLRQRQAYWFRFGGLAILSGFLAAFFLDDRLVMTTPLWGLLCGTFVVFGFGLWDDLFELSWKAQIFFQVMLSLLLFLFGVRILFITNPFGGVWSLVPQSSVLPAFVVGLAWLLLVMNALNWLDGSDGLFGGISLIALLTIFFLSLKPEVHQPAFAILAAAGAGSVLGFLLFNIPPARIFAGTSGSMFLGFLLVFLATAAGTKIATSLLVLVLPIADAFLVIIERLMSGAPVFERDRRHVHHKLARMGWSQGRITVSLVLCTVLIAYMALVTKAENKLFALVAVFVLALLALFSLTRHMKHLYR